MKNNNIMNLLKKNSKVKFKNTKKEKQKTV